MNSLLSITFIATSCFAFFLAANAFLHSTITSTSGRKVLSHHNKLNRISSTALSENLSRNNQLVGKKVTSRKTADVPQKMIHLLERMISTKKFAGSSEFRYDNTQIEEKIKQYKINLAIPDKASGLLLLRIAITAGRRDVCKVLLKHGASQLAMDDKGIGLGVLE